MYRYTHTYTYIKVVRTKNRMDPVVDEHPVYAGYRDVALNLRFRSEEACDLGLDSHVCELRLILMSIADLYQGEDGQARHARYLRYRNSRSF